MNEIRELIGGSPAGRELYVEARVTDWFRLQEAVGWAISVVYSSNVNVKLMGDSARTFKPNQTMYIYVRISILGSLNAILRYLFTVTLEQTQ